jgi:DNA repair protein RadC
MTKPHVYHIPGVSISLVREEGVRLSARPQVREPRSAAKLLAQYIGDRDRETFVVALLSVRHRVLAFNTVSVGCATSALVHAREVFKPAILAGAAAVILSHNHPSGDPEPSAEDLSLTRRLVAAGTLLGIDVLDHVIIGELGRFVSLKERGVLA